MRDDRERFAVADEIDLFELVGAVWRQKVILLVTACVVFAAALVYAMTATPLYEAKASVGPPSQNDIAQLNYGREGGNLKPFSVKDVYAVYLVHLQSQSLRREFFRSVYLPTLTDAERQGAQNGLYNRFNAMLEIGLATKGGGDLAYVKVVQADPRLAAQWVVRYIEMAGDRATQEMISTARSDFLLAADNIDQGIAAERESARRQREDEIIRLNEALRVAQSIGLEKPPVVMGGVSTAMDGELTYMRGSKALQAEIENLRNRASDDPFIARLRERQESVAFYRGAQFDKGLVQSYQQDGAIDSPDVPIKPNKTLIVIIGAVAGISLGVLIALLRHMLLVRGRGRKLQ